MSSLNADSKNCGSYCNLQFSEEDWIQMPKTGTMNFKKQFEHIIWRKEPIFLKLIMDVKDLILWIGFNIHIQSKLLKHVCHGL